MALKLLDDAGLAFARRAAQYLRSIGHHLAGDCSTLEGCQSAENWSEELGNTENDKKTSLLTDAYPTPHEYLTTFDRHISVMKKTQLFQVWKSFGQGLRRGPRFAYLEDAIRFAFSQSSLASFAIQKPSGDWHRFGGNRCILPRSGNPCQ